ncbi:hypothetical protein AVEN_257900-1 [Araneus ventricosus]|uniref:Uncharacterized protein n=1 Tax=Araneus ventricosus TaxID=182803 RepID=A0A4Y2LM64_ARAVE|nr:hypothetical protein AVEN_257900-1 [Araneus ventricosus]
MYSVSPAEGKPKPLLYPSGSETQVTYPAASHPRTPGASHWDCLMNFGSYLFKENFGRYTPFREEDIHKDLKKKSSLTDDIDILRLFRKTGTLSKEKVENLKEQLCFIPDQHKWFYEQVLHENRVNEII